MANPTDEKVTAPDYAAFHQAQGALCKANGWPWFAPKVCWKCKQEVYAHPRAQANANKHLITGCYHCHWSYCD